MNKRLLLIALGSILASCGNDELRISHLQLEAAYKFCDYRNGLKNIYNPSIEAEKYRCGRNCRRPTGLRIYKVQYECMDGTFGRAEFKLHYTQEDTGEITANQKID